MAKPIVRLLQGNEACAEAALAVGLEFFAGYPITPSTEIAEVLSERLPRVGGVFIQMEDEIASMAAVIGASLAGKKAMTATSGPGFSLKQENLGFAAMAETPCVIVNVQRAGPSTGMPTRPSQADFMQSRWGTHGDHPVVVYCPWSVTEVYELTVLAFNTSEILRVPVVLMIDEIIAHLRERFYVAGKRFEIQNRKRFGSFNGEQHQPDMEPEDDVPLMPAIGDGFRLHVTGLYHDDSGQPTNDPSVATRLLNRLCGKVERRRERISMVEMVQVEDAEIVVFAYGAVARSCLVAIIELRRRGYSVGLVRAITLWPFPDEVVESIAKKVRLIVVPEMNLGQASREVQRASCGHCRVMPLTGLVGEMIKPMDVAEAIESEVGRIGPV